MKRFYSAASLERHGDGFGLALDERPVRTPARAPLRVASKALAEALRDEWAAQGERIDPSSMPLSRLANTAIDLTKARRGAMVAELVRYGGTDLLCHRAERPPELVARQAAAWQPLLDWLRERHGIALRAAAGVVPQRQDPQSLSRLERVAGAGDDFELTALHAAAAGTGSVAVGLALMAGRVTADEAADAAFLDDLYQIGRWGADAEAEARLADGRREIAVAARFARLLGG